MAFSSVADQATTVKQLHYREMTVVGGRQHTKIAVRAKVITLTSRAQ